MSTILVPARGRSWVLRLTALCIVLGGLLGLSLKTNRFAVTHQIITDPALAAVFNVMKDKNAELTRELSDLKEKYRKLIESHEPGTASSQALLGALNDAELMAGIKAVHGPGIVVTVHDSPKLDRLETNPEIVKEYEVHEMDIVGIVNTLYSAGAEAISINDQRLIASSSVKCGGAIVLVNSVQTAPPFVIKAIGKPDVLETALTMRGGVTDSLFLLEMIDIKREPDMIVSSYTGTMHFRLAKPVPEEKK